MKKNYVKPKEIRKQYKLSNITLQRWVKSGKIHCLTTPTARYMYDTNEIDKILGNEQQEERKKLCYARVSSTKQKEDLQRQVNELRQQYPTHQIIQDIGSGINWQRKAFNKLLHQICEGSISEIVVMHKDRLCRFAFELLQQICTKFQTKLLVHSENEDAYQSAEEEFSKDLLSTINVFLARNNGKRASKNKRRREKTNSTKAKQQNQYQEQETQK
jgi:predicted site-specific integrase-resolvase